MPCFSPRELVFAPKQLQASIGPQQGNKGFLSQSRIAPFSIDQRLTGFTKVLLTVADCVRI